MRHGQDEVLVVMAGQLGLLVDPCGGPGWAHLLLGPLRRLALVEEPAVRDQAVTSLDTVCGALQREAGNLKGAARFCPARAPTRGSPSLGLAPGG